MYHQAKMITIQSTPTGGRVIQISANDPDDGSNGEIIYTFGPSKL